MISARLTHFVMKRVRARRLGLWLGRSADFRLPTSVLVNGERKGVHFPEQHGVKVAFAELLLGDCYGLGQVEGAVRTVLDIGANVGIFCLAARNAFPEAVIHAYEPNARLEPYLRVQAEAARCRYFLEAVGVRDGAVRLFVDDAESVQTRSESDPAGPIPAVAFAKAIQRLGGAVDLVKMDCEGAEWEIFEDRGAWRCVRNVSLEYHLSPGRSHSEVPEILRGLGFTVRRHSPGPGFGLTLASRHDH